MERDGDGAAGGLRSPPRAYGCITAMPLLLRRRACGAAAARSPLAARVGAAWLVCIRYVWCSAAVAWHGLFLWMHGCAQERQPRDLGQILESGL